MKPGDIVQLSKEGKEKTITNVDGIVTLWWGQYFNRVGFISGMTSDKFPQSGREFIEEEGEYVVSWHLDPNNPSFYGCETMKEQDLVLFDIKNCNLDHNHEIVDEDVYVGNYDKDAFADWPWATRWLGEDGMVRTYDTKGVVTDVEPLHPSHPPTGV